MTDNDQVPSQFDEQALLLLRENVELFLKRAGQSIATNNPGRILDIAPQDHAGVKPFFPDNVPVETLDIDEQSGAKHIGDLCDANFTSSLGLFDAVICTEVLEHTLRPFDACANIFELLRPGGRVYVSTPFNFRIHGPLPDCWRFTEHGLRELFREFDLETLDALETEGRFLMPIQYTLVARRPMGQ